MNSAVIKLASGRFALKPAISEHSCIGTMDRSSLGSKFEAKEESLLNLGKIRAVVNTVR